MLRVMEVFDRLAPRAAPLADGVIAATDAEAEHFRHLGARRVEIIAPAVDKTVARASTDARVSARAEFGLTGEPTVSWSPGRPRDGRAFRLHSMSSGCYGSTCRRRGSCLSVLSLTASSLASPGR